MPERGRVRHLDRGAGQGRDGQGPAREVERAVLLIVVEGAQVGDGLDDRGQNGGGRDTDEDGALHLPHVQDDHEEQAEEEHEDRPALKRPAQPQLQRGAAGSHHLGVHQADEGDEQADAHADRGLDMGRDGLEDGLAETGEHQDEDDDALDDDQPHGVGVGHSVHADQGVGDHRVDAQPRRQGHGVVGDQAHEDGHDPGDQGGAGGDLLGGAQRGDALVLGGQDERVEHEDVGHREEGDDAAADLAGDGRAALGDMEEGVEAGAEAEAGEECSPGCGGVCTHDAILPDATGPARAATTVRMFRSGGSRPGRGAVDHLEATAESSAGSRPGPGRRGRLEP